MQFFFKLIHWSIVLQCIGSFSDKSEICSTQRLLVVRTPNPALHIYRLRQLSLLPCTISLLTEPRFSRYTRSTARPSELPSSNQVNPLSRPDEKRHSILLVTWSSHSIISNKTFTYRWRNPLFLQFQIILMFITHEIQT